MKKYSKLIRYAAAALATVAMVAAGEMSGSMEVIFPEAMALFLGAWAAERMPWKVSRLSLVILITAAAVTGILLVRWLTIPGLPAEYSTWFRMILGYALVAAYLLIGRSTFLPAVSACILPVLMGTEQWIYPAAVFTMAAVTMGGQWLMERTGLLIETDGPGPQFHLNEQRRIWLTCLPLMAVLSATALFSGLRFMTAPPLIVALVTFAGKASPAGRKALKIYLVIAACGLIGAFCRMGLCQTLGASFTLCALAASILVLLLCHFTGVFFPPAGALAILPVLIPEDMLTMYPLHIALGAAFCVGAGRLVSRAGVKHENNR